MTWVRRQLVGGPADGQWVDVEQGESVYLAPGRPKPVRITSTFTMSDTVEYDRDLIQYQAATAPTGERVFLAPGAVYPERFDTAEWVRQRAPYLRDLTHVGPWIWRGRAYVDPADVDPVVAERFIRPRYWEYIGISACGRYELRQQVIDLDVNDIDDEHHTRDMRYRIAYAQLPTCPEFDCDEKAVATVTPGVRADMAYLYGERIRYRERFALCREHVRTMTMLNHWLRPGPDVIDREGNPYVDPNDNPYSSGHAVRAALYSFGVVNPSPAELFRITNVY